METSLTNTASALGNYDSIPTSITSTASVITMISGLTIKKEADKKIWADGNLTYTITISNQSDKTYENPTITDVLDGSLVTFVENSVYIDGVQATADKYNYEAGTNTLTVTLENISTTSERIVKFQVSKK